MGYTTATLVLTKLGSTQAKLTAEGITSTMITQYITWADDEIERVSSKIWGTDATTKTEYFDLVQNPYRANWMNEGGIITGKLPYVESRYNYRLTYSPVYSVESVTTLNRIAEIDKLYSYDASEETYTDNTTEANSVKGTSFYAFSEIVAENDIMYLGGGNEFTGVTMRLATEGIGGVLTWEYYNGSWTTLTVSESVSGADDLNASGTVSWTVSADWTETTVDSTEMYWIRAKVSTAHSTSPKVNEVSYKEYFNSQLNSSSYFWDDTGRVVLLSDFPSEGVDKIMIKYTLKVSSVPVSVQRLSTAIAAKEAIKSLIAKSYADATSYNVSCIEINKGEPYTNLREAIKQIDLEIYGNPEAGIKGLWDEVGRDVSIFIV